MTQPEPIASPVVPPPAENASVIILQPKCMQCGREDETVRFVQIPWVASLLVITFRRAWTGVWCARHRSLRAIAAAAVTTGIGWLGIPYGLIYTPIVLFQLAQGDGRFDEINAGLLTALAEKKSGAGDYDGARKCLEAALQYQDNQETRAKLIAGRLRQASAEPSGAGRKALAAIGLLAGAAALGTGIGLADALLTGLLAFVPMQNQDIFFTLISWLPYIALLGAGGLALMSLLAWAFDRLETRSRPGAVALACLAVAVMLYGVFEGSELGVFGIYIFQAGIGDPAEFVVALVYLLLFGGYEWLVVSSGDPSAAGMIYKLLTLLAAGFYLLIAIQIAYRLAGWRKRLHELYQPK